jgi:hypothetical protein
MADIHTVDVIYYIHRAIEELIAVNVTVFYECLLFLSSEVDWLLQYMPTTAWNDFISIVHCWLLAWVLPMNRWCFS